MPIAQIFMWAPRTWAQLGPSAPCKQGQEGWLLTKGQCQVVWDLQ